MEPTSSSIIDVLSPSRLSRLSCPARVAFEQLATGSRPDSPSALLGTATHLGVERLLAGEPSEGAWTSACDLLAKTGPDPRSLPGARGAVLRFQRHCRLLNVILSESLPHELVIEQLFVSSDGLLSGTPDLVLVRPQDLIIIDHKTSLVERDGVVSDSMKRQMQFYAGLASESYKLPVARAVLLSTRQGAFDVDSSLGSIQGVLADARLEQASFNSRVPGPQPFMPSPAACQWCPYSVRCDGFWGSYTEAWSSKVGLCLQGVLLDPPETAANRKSAIRVLLAENSPLEQSAVVIGGIPSSKTTGFRAGDELAITGLRASRQDNSTMYWTEYSLIGASKAQGA